MAEKKNEPRVRTLEECKSLPNDAVSYLEIRKKSSLHSICNLFPKSLIPSFLWEEEYGIQWRMWDRKTTAKQRASVPWEENL